MRLVVVSCLAMVGVCLSASAADWPQWRGPARDGVAPDGPPLAEGWGEDAPPLVWESEEIPSGGSGGSGSPVVAAERVYVFANEKYRVPLATRTLTEKDLRELGWSDVKLPEALARTVEAARTGDQRAGLDGEQRREWIDRFLAEHLKTEQDRELYGRCVADRLQRGPKALPLDVLARLEAIKDKELPDAEALDKWLTDSGIDGDDRKAVLRAVPVDVEKAWDTVYCLSAADGRTAWKWRTDGRPEGHGASGTPCIAGGRCYVAGSTGMVYCLDAATGRELWRTQATEKPDSVHASVLVAGRTVAAMMGRLVALDAETGSLLWRQEKVSGDTSSPVTWSAGGRTYILCNAGRGVACVDLETGRIAWEASPGGGRSTVAVRGDRLAVLTGRKEHGLVLFGISPDKAEKLWSVADCPEGDSSPLIHKGHVYVFSRNTALCVELQTGKVAWSRNTGSRGCSSPAVADDKLLIPISKWLYVYRATPRGCEELGKLSLSPADHTSLAVADGRVYLRLRKSVACYDLRASAAPASAPAALR